MLQVCDSLGFTRCTGVTLAGYSPICLGQYAEDAYLCPFALDATRVVTVGTFLAAGSDCAPYFDCAPGFYKRFGPTGTVDCEECQGALPALFGWISGGLSANDPTSCVMECQVRALFHKALDTLVSEPESLTSWPELVKMYSYVPPEKTIHDFKAHWYKPMYHRFNSLGYNVYLCILCILSYTE